MPAALNLSTADLLREMRVYTAGGRVLGGADAVVFLARHIWWAWPLFALAQMPGMRAVFHAVYRWVAGHRHCTASGCVLPSHGGIP